MAKLPDKRELHSKDKRRVATYEPHIVESAGQAVSAYRLIRLVRKRRGFGTVIHTLTTFVRNKKDAQKSAAHWVSITTKDR